MYSKNIDDAYKHTHIYHIKYIIKYNINIYIYICVCEYLHVIIRALKFMIAYKYMYMHIVHKHICACTCCKQICAHVHVYDRICTNVLFHGCIDIVIWCYMCIIYIYICVQTLITTQPSTFHVFSKPGEAKTSFHGFGERWKGAADRLKRLQISGPQWKLPLFANSC